MRNSVVASFALGLGLCLAASAQTGSAAVPTKIGIINVQAAMIGTKDGQAADKALQERSAPKQKELESKRSEIEKLREQLNRSANTASEEQKRKLMGDIDARTKAFNRDVEDAQAELDQERNRVLQDLSQRMWQVIDKYSRDNNYAVILDVSNPQTPVVSFSSALDITREIIDLYDKNAPPTTGTPSGAAAPTGAARPGMTAPRPPAGTTAPHPTAPKPAPAK